MAGSDTSISPAVMTLALSFVWAAFTAQRGEIGPADARLFGFHCQRDGESAACERVREEWSDTGSGDVI